MKFKDSGARTEFDTGARRDCQEGKGRMDLLPFRAIMAVSKIYETGCIKYGDRNWEKGIPLSRYIDSGMRHLSKWMIGMDDEPHLDMAIWNLLGARDTIARIQEGLLPESLNDLPCNPYFQEEDDYEYRPEEGEPLGIHPQAMTKFEIKDVPDVSPETKETLRKVASGEYRCPPTGVPEAAAKAAEWLQKSADADAVPVYPDETTKLLHKTLAKAYVRHLNREVEKQLEEEGDSGI